MTGAVRIWVVVAASVGAAVLWSAPGLADGLPNSGIRGLITEGPACPGPQRQGGDECGDREASPVAAEVRVLRQRDGVEMARFRSRSDGRFRIRLRRGRYLLDPLEGPWGIHKGTIPVKVQRDAFTRVRIQYDNGER